VAKRTAVIDIGSNSVRIAIFEKSSRFAFHLLDEAKSPVRISAGAYENGGYLQEEAMLRAITALGDFLSIARSYHIRKLLCVATSAVRDAPNKSVFLSRVRQELGLDIKVISGVQEAYFGAIAAANLLPEYHAITLDIGGGSTESAHLNQKEVTASYSLDLGTVRLKELFFDKNDIEGATKQIDQAIATLPFENVHHVIGIGGTLRALGRALMKANAYPMPKLHAFTYDATQLIEHGTKILEAKPDRLKELGIKPDRFDIIKPGILILLRVIKHFEITTITTSGVGVREGVFLHDMLRHQHFRFPANFNPSVRYLLDRYVIDTNRSNQMAKVCGILFDLFQNHWHLESRYRRMLIIAAKLSKIGASLHYYSQHHHGYYLIQTALEYGFSHHDILLIATLVRYQKRKLPKKEHKEFFEILLPDYETLDYLSTLLTLADILLQHHPKNIDFRLSCNEETLIVETLRPLYLAQEQIQALPDFDVAVSFHQVERL
jgi:exopolyphosphatase / guanosine-5'-triphosphate,3'-diphosphate pyrophosphatase